MYLLGMKIYDNIRNNSMKNPRKYTEGDPYENQQRQQ